MRSSYDLSQKKPQIYDFTSHFSPLGSSLSLSPSHHEKADQRTWKHTTTRSTITTPPLPAPPPQPGPSQAVPSRIASHSSLLSLRSMTRLRNLPLLPLLSCTLHHPIRALARSPVCSTTCFLWKLYILAPNLLNLSFNPLIVWILVLLYYYCSLEAWIVLLRVWLIISGTKVDFQLGLGLGLGLPNY